jgi:hypothetical protein
MEKVFSALSNADRLWVVMYLAAEGPQRQKDLIAALHDADPTRRARNGGSMSNLVTPLVDAGILRRDGPKGELRLANPEQVRRLLALTSAISTATAAESSQRADEQHARLMRTITQATAERESPTG